jgi:hypothetical protein
VTAGTALVGIGGAATGRRLRLDRSVAGDARLAALCATSGTLVFPPWSLAVVAAYGRCDRFASGVALAASRNRLRLGTADAISSRRRMFTFECAMRSPARAGREGARTATRFARHCCALHAGAHA